jgi:hypothetical protein
MRMVNPRRQSPSARVTRFRGSRIIVKGSVSLSNRSFPGHKHTHLFVAELLPDWVTHASAERPGMPVIALKRRLRDREIDRMAANFHPNAETKTKTESESESESETARQASQLTAHRRWSYPMLLQSHPLHLSLQTVAGLFDCPILRI